MDLTIGKSRDRDFAVDAQELVTGRTCIIAQSGAGKSWSIAVLCERLCAEGIGFCLIDTEGEYFSLKDKFPVIWLGTDEECDDDIETVNLREFMTQAVRNGTAVVYDVSETDMQERVSKLANIIYDIASELRIPYLLIVEEADKFIPQSKESIKKIEEISRRGRKRGLGLLVATQRPALVTKNVLSQCNNQIIGKLSIENDLKAVDLFFDSRREVEELAELEPGEFFVMGKISREKTRMRFGKRLTKHRGLTPQLAPRQKPQPKQCEDAEKPAREEPREETPQPRTEPTPAFPQAVALKVSREEALETAQRKRKRKVLGIGPEESIVSFELTYWPLIDVEVRFIGGVIKKATKTANFSIDGLEGRNVEFNGTLRFRTGFSELIGLSEQEIHMLSCMTPDGATEADLEAKTKLGPTDVRKALKTLREQKKVTVKAQLGDAEIYVPLLVDKIPNLSRLKTVPALLQEPAQAQIQDPEIDEKDLRIVLKGLEPTAEIVSFTTFAYPVYEVSYATPETQRTLVIDGVGGGIIDA